MPPLPPNPLGIKIIAFSAAGLFADFVVVSLRLWARKLRKQRLAVGDWLIVASWFFALTDFIRRIIAYKWGAGLHLQQILETDPSHLLDAVKISYACYFIWNAAVTCIKLSILFVYLELFRIIKWFVWCVRFTMLLCVLFFLGFAAMLVFRCSPMEKNFNYTVEGICTISLPDMFILGGSLNMLLDVVLVVLPIPVVWGLRIGRTEKMGICAMFGLGLFILIFVGFRFKMIEEINPDDLIHDIEPPGILVALELYLGMICACLPFLAPPISKLYKAMNWSNIFNKITWYTSRARSDERTIMARPNSDFSVASWPRVNGYGRSYKVECDSENTHEVSNKITLTSEWEVKVVKNKESFSSGNGLLEDRH